MFKFLLGESVREKITGLEGIILARAEYATGCRHYGIQQRMITSEGKIPDYEWIDESRLESLGQLLRDVIKHYDEEDPGGPEQNPPQY